MNVLISHKSINCLLIAKILKSRKDFTNKNIITTKKFLIAIPYISEELIYLLKEIYCPVKLYTTKTTKIKISTNKLLGSISIYSLLKG